MKRLLQVVAVAAICLLLGSCAKTPQQQAEDLIEEYYQQHLNDPSSYECIRMGSLGKLTPMAVAVPKIANECEKRNLSDSTDAYIARFKAQLEESGSDPYEHLGWALRVKYRAKNAFGGYVVREDEFIFDTAVTTIADVKEVQ